MPKINIELDLDIDEKGLAYLQSLHQKEELGSTFSYWIQRISQGDMILNAEEILDIVTDMLEEQEGVTDEQSSLANDEILATVENKEIIKEESETIMKETDLVMSENDEDLFSFEDENEVVETVMKSDELVTGGDDLFSDDLFEDEETKVINDDTLVLKSDDLAIGDDIDLDSINFDDLSVDEIEEEKEVKEQETVSLESLNSKMNQVMEMLKTLQANGVTISSTNNTKQKDEFDELIVEEIEYPENETTGELTFSPADFARMSMKLHG